MIHRASTRPYVPPPHPLTTSSTLSAAIFSTMTLLGRQEVLAQNVSCLGTWHLTLGRLNTAQLPRFYDDMNLAEFKPNGCLGGDFKLQEDATPEQMKKISVQHSSASLAPKLMIGNDCNGRRV